MSASGAELERVEVDNAAALGEADSREDWNALPPSVRRATLEWIAQAKRPDTRAKRVAATAEEAKAGRASNSWPR